jgi:hypothetical protein
LLLLLLLLALLRIETQHHSMLLPPPPPPLLLLLLLQGRNTVCWLAHHVYAAVKMEQPSSSPALLTVPSMVIG